ncbi:LolA family protein [Maricaulis sp. CAU 1757]
MITLLASLALLQASAPTDSAAPAEPAAAIATDSAAATLDRDAALAGINAWLNDLTTLRARFTQYAPDGSVAGGVLSLSRPGRLRFEYDEPSPVRVIADGTTVAFEDTALETMDRAPLRSTPLWWLLKPEIDLARDAEIVDISQDAGLLYLTLRDAEAEMQGEMTVVFAQPSLELRGWYVLDALGETTRVTLSDASTGMTLDPRLFVIPDESDREDRRRNRR